MKTAMIIVNYNDYDSTIKLVNNVKDYKTIEKIVIVDNNSREEEKNKLKKIRNKKVKVIYNEDNKGYSYAINIGSKYLIDEFGKCNIIISNADIIIDNEKNIKDLLKILVRKDVGVVAPVILENKHLNRGWKLTTPNQEILFNIPKLYKHFEKKYRYYGENHYINDTSEVDVVSGCFFLIKSTTLEKIDFLDENIFLYYEENILAKKLGKVNLKEIIVNNVIVIHNHSVTIDRNVNQLKKYKILKKSQYYYNRVYNNASKVNLFLLRIVNKTVEMILKINYHFVGRR